MTLYNRPSYQELRDRIAADLAAMPAVLREPLSAAWARACHGEHGHLDWLYAQCAPLECEEDRLQDWATLYRVERLRAVGASGDVVFVGTPGSIMLKDALLRGANGLDYAVSEAVPVSGSGGTARVLCQTTGAEGNLPAGAKLSLVDPILGIAGEVTVGASGLSGGAAQESVEDWRARVVDEWQTITTVGARGGRAGDYEFWTLSAHPSITGALVQRHELGIGVLTIRPICNGLAQRLPTAAVLDAVRAKLLATAPVMPDLVVVEPLLKPVPITLKLAVTVDTAANRTAITDAITKVILDEQGANAVLLLSEIDAAVAAVTNQYLRTAPVADIQCAAGEMLSLPLMSWS